MEEIGVKLLYYVLGGSWVWNVTEKAKSLVVQREASNLNTLLFIYLILWVDPSPPAVFILMTLSELAFHSRILNLRGEKVKSGSKADNLVEYTNKVTCQLFMWFISLLNGTIVKKQNFQSVFNNITYFIRMH